MSNRCLTSRFSATSPRATRPKQPGETRDKVNQQQQQTFHCGPE